MKILIVNLMQIGDLVLTTPVFEAIKKAYPDAFLAAAVNNQFSILVDFNPYLDHVFKVDKSSFSSFFRTLNLIRNEHFDFAFNLNRSERASALTAFSNAAFIAGYAKPPFNFLFNRVHPNRNRSMHQIFSHFFVLNDAGFNLNPCQPSIFIPQYIQDRINRFWDSHFKPSDTVVALNVGASWPSKRWLPSYFALLADSLFNRGCRVVFLGSSSDSPIVNLCLSLMNKE